MSKISEDFGNNIRLFRITKGLSQERLGELSELHPSYIGQIERGEKNCTLKSIEKIAKGLEIPMEQLTKDLMDINISIDIPPLYKQLSELSYQDQKIILEIMKKIIEYKHM
ncbi:MAG: helix-turn-helix domain-containing protein [Ruminococcus sp.]|nr:helix-turn-helix domain-containing protein [Ruminococcus sp.]